MIPMHPVLMIVCETDLRRRRGKGEEGKRRGKRKRRGKGKEGKGKWRRGRGRTGTREGRVGL